MKDSTAKEIKDKKVHRLPCRKCDGHTNHEVLESVEVPWEKEDDGIHGCDVFEIVTCRGCGEISFRSSSTNSEDITYFNDGTAQFDMHEELYPNRIAGRKEIDIYSLPEPVRTMYQETHKALCTGLNILAGIGMGTLIESVCREKNAQGQNLENKINDLVSKGVLTIEGASILHMIRDLRNRYAHEIIVLGSNKLDVAMDVIENLLNSVYVIPKKAERLKK
jgi:hypothetical protein